MIEYAGTVCTNLNLQVKDLINIPCPEDDLETIEIPGRDGVLVKDKKRKKPIQIEINFNYIAPKEKWHDIWRKAKKWLLQKNQKLILDDDSDHYYRCLYVIIGINERTSLRIGGFTATFVCDPYQYLNSGDMPLELIYENISAGQSAHIWNPYEASMPIFVITGSGTCRLTINGNILEADVTEKLTIDTGRELAYKADSSSANTNVACDYEDLALIPGDNTIIKPVGFDLQILPKWRET